MKLLLSIIFSLTAIAAYSQNNTFPTTGNVGIGTTTPTSKLSIDGNINGWLISSKATVTAAGEYNGIKLLTGYPNDTNKWAAVVATAEDLHSNLTALAFYSTASEKMRIAGNGNVGIGTVSPQAKLAVKGNIVAEQIKVTSNIAVPDYVFDSDYKMLSLKDIETYVKEHKHLPEIPSAKTINENGLDLGAMNLLLLKKVEELTLHLIQGQANRDDLKKGYNERINLLEGKIEALNTKIKALN
jgi:hypothetical protein